MRDSAPSIIMIVLALLIGRSAESGQKRAENRAAAITLHKRMDIHHDGYVTFAELQSAASSMVVPNGISPGALPDNQIARRQFDQADVNHDGRISLKEATESADKAFAIADKDHDGIFSPQEQRDYMARALADLQKDISQWKALPYQPGALCATARPGLATEVEKPKGR